ncbi:MAG TPA: PP2C family protein-serine/threonine phosphatase [Bryobacteraceae bacterium]|jgi:serine phosphatase RsbU (regulator of sigma subunit)|nr:PP2C family protein-serine/threonine phosphatase [Bryobacteraceae bacterium]
MLPPHSDHSETIHFQQNIARLEALLEASRQVHGALELDDVLHCILEIAVKELEGDGAFFTDSEAIASARQKSYGHVPDWAHGEHPEEWAACPNIRLLDKRGQLLTRLVVLRPGKPLSLEEQDFLEGLGLQSAVAVENARQHKRLLAWERVQQDLDAARVIQRSLLPQTVPTISGYHLDYRCKTCFEVGGDYVDILASPDGRYTMIVADVAGKGLASALMSASFRAAFRAMAVSGLPIDELAGRINDLHYSEGPEARLRYVTAIILRLDARLHQAEVINAGHNPGFIVQENGCHSLLAASGPPLGMLPNMRYSVERCSLPQNAKVLFYTDGLTEVFQRDEEFGMQRLLQAFVESTERDCGALLDCLWRQLGEFAGSTEQSDDMTALALLRHAPKDA